jgi:hypothetical protein
MSAANNLVERLLVQLGFGVVVQVLDVTVELLLVMVRSETWVYNERPVVTFVNCVCKGKDEVNPRTGHEGPEGVQV